MSLLTLDQRLTNWLYIGNQASPATERFLFTLASVFIYLLPIILLYLFFRSRDDRAKAINVTAMAILSWQILSKFLGSFIYNHYGFRDRPFASHGLTEFLFEQPQKAFPSDHAAVLMAVTLGFFYYRYPKLGWLFLIGGVLSSLGRVVIGFHWFGDVIGGWLLAVVAFYLWRIVDQPVSRWLVSLTNWLPTVKPSAEPLAKPVSPPK